MRAHRGRVVAVGLLCAMLVFGAIVFAHRRPQPDARQALIASLATLQAGNYNAARSNARAAVAAAPNLGMAHAILARAYLELGDGLAAEAELARAVDAGLAVGRLHQLRAQARLLQGDPDGAIEEAARTTPRYAGYATRIVARALAAKGDPVAAQARLETLLASAPRDSAAWTDLGRIRLSAGDIGGAGDAAARAVALARGEPAALTLQGEVVRSRYGLIAALPWFEAALRRDAYHYPALIQYAATLGEAGRSADMLAATRRALAARPGSGQALYLQAVLAARAGRYDLSRALLHRTGPAMAGVAGVMLLDGMLDYTAGKYEQAIAAWQPLVAAQPMNVAVRRLLGAALMRSGDTRAALDLLRPIGMRGDADGYALALIGRGLESLGDGAGGQFLDRSAAGADGASTVFAANEAVGALQAAAAAAGDDPTYAIGAIRALAGSGDVARALADARALAGNGPGAPAAQLALGDMQAVTGSFPAAAATYSRAADLAFDEPTMLRLIDTLARAGRAKDGAAALSVYLTQNPQSLSGRRLLGHLQVAAGQWEEGIETLEGVRRRIGNRDGRVLADLARAYAGDGDGAVAVRYARAAYALSPMSADSADAYGVALAANGDGRAARQLLEKAIKLAPRDAAIAARLAQLR